MDYKQKYLKYKQKYLELKNQYGGDRCPFEVGSYVVITGPVGDPYLHRIGKITQLHFENYLIGPPTGEEGPKKNVRICDSATIFGINYTTTNIRHFKDLITILPIRHTILSNISLVEALDMYNKIDELKIPIQEHPFDFFDQPIPVGMKLAQFRYIFKAAIGINIVDPNISTAEFMADIMPTLMSGKKLKLNLQRAIKLTDEIYSKLSNMIHTLIMPTNNFFNMDDFFHFRGIHTLDITSLNVTDAALHHLKGIHTLLMGDCTNITNAGLAHLHGIQRLNISNNQNITDEGLRHLRGIHTLIMVSCRNITDDGLAHLRGIHTLDISRCDQITPNGIAYLYGIKKLNMSWSNPLTINEARRLGIQVSLTFDPSRRDPYRYIDF